MLGSIIAAITAIANAIPAFQNILDRLVIAWAEKREIDLQKSKDSADSIVRDAISRVLSSSKAGSSSLPKVDSPPTVPTSSDQCAAMDGGRFVRLKLLGDESKK